MLEQNGTVLVCGKTVFDKIAKSYVLKLLVSGLVERAGEGVKLPASGERQTLTLHVFFEFREAGDAEGCVKVDILGEAVSNMLSQKSMFSLPRASRACCGYDAELIYKCKMAIDLKG